MRSIFIIVSLFAINFCFGQRDTTRAGRLDTLTFHYKKDSAYIYRFQKLRLYLSIDNRNSLINKTPVNFKGFQIGAIINEKNILGIGFYAINQNSKKPVATRDGTVSAQKSLSMNYLTLFYIYQLIDKRRFELDLPVEIGIGGYNITYSDSLTGRIYKTQNGGLIPIGIGVQTVFKPTKWVGISLLLGYRAVADNSKVQSFNGWYSSIGLNFDIRQIVRDFKFHRLKKDYKADLKQIRGF